MDKPVLGAGLLSRPPVAIGASPYIGRNPLLKYFDSVDRDDQARHEMAAAAPSVRGGAQGAAPRGDAPRGGEGAGGGGARRSASLHPTHPQTKMAQPVQFPVKGMRGFK